MSFWNVITGTTPQADQQASADAIKAGYEAALQRRIQAGTISDSTAASDQAYLDSVALDSTDQAAWTGFQEGAAAGLNNVLNAPGNIVGGAGSVSGRLLWGILKNIPWWVWLAGLGVGFFYLGGGIIVRRLVAKHFK